MSDNTAQNLFDAFSGDFQQQQPENMTLPEYLERCKADKMAYASAPERLLAAIGKPEIVNTADDPRLSLIHQNQPIERYATFSDFYGMEDAISKVVGFLRHAAQGLEESKQILYLLGPVGGGKSSLSERLKELMEVNPIYVLAYNHADGTQELSPVNESPLALFDAKKHGDKFKAMFDIDSRYLKTIASPWAIKRLKEAKGDLSKFSVVKVYPSKANQLAIAKVEPGDDNNQDISTLVGKVSLDKLEEYAQNDPDAYLYSGGLNRGNRGIMEFVEMFKAPIKALNPLLEATQGKNYNGTEAIGSLPWDGIILAHSNESEWESFKGARKNEAFIARVVTVKVPYALQVDEEVKIYKKLVKESVLGDLPIAPRTLEILAEFSVLSRLVEPENSSLYSKMRVYNGENLKETDPTVKSLAEYKAAAGVDEGMEGIDTRWAFKRLSTVFNANSMRGEEPSAMPITLFSVLREDILQSQFDAKLTEKYNKIIDTYLEPRYKTFLQKQIQEAALETYDTYGQKVFESYFVMAEAWLDNKDHIDKETGHTYNRSAVEKELEKFEKPASISSSKDFRAEIVRYVYKHRGMNEGKMPSWKSYEKIKTAIEKSVLKDVNEILPIITASGAEHTEENKKKHHSFVQGMEKLGYTPAQTQKAVKWFTANKDRIPNMN